MADTVNLLSSDGKSFAVLAKVASMSKTLRDLMEDGELSCEACVLPVLQSSALRTLVMADTVSAAGADNIPLPTIDAKILEKVVAYCMQHVDDPAPAAPVADDKKLELSDKPIEISTWDKEFTSGMDQGERVARAFRSFLRVWCQPCVPARGFMRDARSLHADASCDYSCVRAETIFQLILAANYLDVRSLLDLCCR